MVSSRAGGGEAVRKGASACWVRGVRGEVRRGGRAGISSDACRGPDRAAVGGCRGRGCRTGRAARGRGPCRDCGKRPLARPSAAPAAHCSGPGLGAASRDSCRSRVPAGCRGCWVVVGAMAGGRRSLLGRCCRLGPTVPPVRAWPPGRGRGWLQRRGRRGRLPGWVAPLVKAVGRGGPGTRWGCARVAAQRGLLHQRCHCQKW